MIGYGKCPRYGVWGDYLETHSHFWECNNCFDRGELATTHSPF